MLYGMLYVLIYSSIFMSTCDLSHITQRMVEPDINKDDTLARFMFS